MGKYGKIDESECSLLGNADEEGQNYQPIHWGR